LIGPSIGDTVELAVTFTASGVLGIEQSLNSGTITSSGDSGALSVPADWVASKFWLNGVNSEATYDGNAEFIELKILPGVHSMGTCRAI
jgi:hypothetical protein